ncbi:MAG: DNA primase DnaG [Candidatus Woesearchaeota archaeon]
MGKISLMAAKYIIHGDISVKGMVDKPDVIGAIFGQTEGLLGSELELRELQKSGRIGRIEVTLDNKSGKTTGSITIPSSLDKSETCIVGAALEVIQRIGPCDSKIKITKIEDVRVSKRKFIVDRAKDLLKDMVDKVFPDSQEISNEVASSVRVMELQSYGREKLPSGPNIGDAEEITIVEGRADVINLLKHGFKNVISMNGSSVPKTIKRLCDEKISTVFLDGDRGGFLEMKQLLSIADVDFVARAPDGKEVEELTKKEIHKCLRSKITADQAKHDYNLDGGSKSKSKRSRRGSSRSKRSSSSKSKSKSSRKSKSKKSSSRSRSSKKSSKKSKSSKEVSKEEKEILKDVLEDLVGTRGAYLLDNDLNILGKVPTRELITTLNGLDEEGVYAVVFDGDIRDNIVSVAEGMDLKYVVGMKNNVKKSSKVILLSSKDL